LPDYFDTLDRLLGRPEDRRLSSEQVETAWHYAYRFFFDFPLPFPWHLLHFWKDMEARPFRQVVGPELGDRYRSTFDHLLGGPAPWQTEQERQDADPIAIAGSGPREVTR
jgi:hypothetical protein